MENPQHTLSIVSVSLNEEAHIERLNSSLDQLRIPKGLTVETIVVDGGSQDRTVEIAQQKGFDQVAKLPGANIPSCRNHGLALAKGDWIAFIDADCEVAPDWLVKAAPWLEEDEPTLIGWPTTYPHPGTWVQRAWHIHWSNKNLSWITEKNQRVVRRQAFRLITARNMLLTRKVIDATRGFDEKLATGDDTDFALRAFDQGVRVIAIPGLCVVHHGEPADLTAFFRQQLWHANRSSYPRIFADIRGRGGHNAPVFTCLFLGCVALALLGIVSALGTGSRYALLGIVPLLGLVIAPAIVIASRARALTITPALGVLYTLYGIARGLDLLGLHRTNRNWKS